MFKIVSEAKLRFGTARLSGGPGAITYLLEEESQEICLRLVNTLFIYRL